MSSRRATIRVLLSVGVVFHLACALIVPNIESVLGQRLQAVILPYAHFFELTDAWSFFAPNPGQPAFVEWEIYDDHGQPFAHERWPEIPSPYFWGERRVRRVGTADFMIKTEGRVEAMLLPYLCRKTPQPHSVRLWRIQLQLPTPEGVASGQRVIGDTTGQDRRLVSLSFCEAYR